SSGDLTGTGWTVVAAKDLNADGHPDLIWQNDQTRQVTVWFMGGAQGATMLTWAWIAQTGVPGWTIVGVADLNGDGHPDLIWQNDQTRQVSVWFMGGAQGTTFLGWTWIAATGAAGWRVVGVGDFNNDGHADLVWQNDGTRQASVWYLGGAQGSTFLGWSWLAATNVP